MVNKDTIELLVPHIKVLSKSLSTSIPVDGVNERERENKLER